MLEVRNLKFFDNYWKVDYTSFAQKQFSTAHIISLIIILILVYLIYILKDKLKIEKKQKIYSSIIGTTLIINQFTLYYWYIDNNELSLKESFPPVSYTHLTLPTILLV